MIEIMHRWDRGKVLYKAESAADVRQALVEAVKGGADLSGAYLRSADLRSAYLSGAYLRSADLRSADLRSAYLRSADLRSADLRSADLRSAYLSGAYLRSADLRSADLSGADLSGALGLAPERTNDLLMLLDQPGPIRAYKLVNAGGDSPITSAAALHYEVGRRLEVENANTDPFEDCGAGINVATLPWVLRNWSAGWRVLIVEFTAGDIACIPHASDGKFRLHRCTVVGEKELDLVALGLVKAGVEEQAAA